MRTRSHEPVKSTRGQSPQLVKSTRRRSPKPVKPTTRGQSPELATPTRANRAALRRPVRTFIGPINRVLRPATPMIARPMSACAGRISLDGRGLCKAPAAAYAASWRAGPPQEWVLDNLPISGSDRLPPLPVPGAKGVGFVESVVTDTRIVSRWIQDTWPEEEPEPEPESRTARKLRF
ncbi:hypothetical protein MMC07_004098 [Pseudocyphellaria aurata]|nr:hypothetical protein [Pseudocyphellaria aurata]